MSLALLNQIVGSENEAEEIRRAAVREARDLIKSVEEVLIIEARQAAKDIREGAQRLTEEARLGTEDEIKALEVRRSAEHAAMRERSLQKVEAAAQMIYERIRSDGNR